MKRYLCGVAMLSLAMSAQEVHQNVIVQAGPDATGNRMQKIRIESRQMSGPAGAMQWTEMGSSAVVKNSPFSAEAVTETVQSLADGNRISRKNTVTQYRDSEGRTRREFALQSLGRLGDVEDGAHRSIIIDDPVAKTHYSLDVATKTAIKMPGADALFSFAMPHAGGPAPGSTPGPAPGPAPGEVGAGFTSVGPGRAIIMTRTLERTVNGPAQVVTEDAVGTFPAARSRFSRASAPAREEDLGSRNIEGVLAKGTRSTVTIPAGEVGNERPIEVVSEQWYSEQLKTYVLTRHSDPRVGETTLRLTNVRLSEPAATLFEVPADYTVKDAAMQIMRKRAEEKRQE